MFYNVPRYFIASVRIFLCTCVSIVALYIPCATAIYASVSFICKYTRTHINYAVKYCALRLPRQEMCTSFLVDSFWLK